MFHHEEQVSMVEQEVPEHAEIEEERVRQSECVNMNVVVLHEALQRLEGDGGLHGHTATDGSALNPSCLPPEMVDALLHHLMQHEEEMQQLTARRQLLEEQRTHDAERAEALHDRTEKLRNAVAAMSARSSADMLAFRAHMQQNANAAKQQQRELIDLTRKREKVELDVKRTQMEAERLRKISKRVK